MPSLMEITTPLGPHVLQFSSMRSHESLGRLFEYAITAVSTRNDIDPKQLLGKNATVKLQLPKGGPRCFDGMVTRFALAGSQGRFVRYEMTLRPWLWFLTRTSDCKIFQEMTVPDIIKEIFGKDVYPDAAFDFRLDGTYDPWEYCVQYRETDFNFVSRLMEQEGMYYYFEHSEGKHTMVVCDSPSAHEPYSNYENIPFVLDNSSSSPEKERVSDWYYSAEVQPGEYVIDDYDFKKPSVDLMQKTKLVREHEHAQHEFFDGAGEFDSAAEGDRYVRIRLEELQAQHERVLATSNARGTNVGYTFSLTGHPRGDQNKQYLITSADISFATNEYESAGGAGATYSCNFECMFASDQFRSPQYTPKPIVQGLQTAKVVGAKGNEIFTDEYGRVKVHFHWDRYGKQDENDSCWIRVSQPWAGKQWGAIHIPRIGQEVVVEFIEGDPDRPLITGRVYNKEQMPPFGLPAAGVISGIKSNTHKGKGYNELSMDDTAGKEKITIHGQYDMGTTVQHDQTNTVKNDFTETITNNAKIEITSGTYSHDVKAGTATYHVQSALTENYDATQATTVKGDITIKSTAGAITISADAQHIYIHAATSIQLHTGASKLWMASDGNISLEGVNITVNGSASVTIKGGIVHSEAASEHQTKGAIVLSEGSATNTVKGGMVMLNP